MYNLQFVDAARLINNTTKCCQRPGQDPSRKNTDEDRLSVHLTCEMRHVVYCKKLYNQTVLPKSNDFMWQKSHFLLQS